MNPAANLRDELAAFNKLLDEWLSAGPTPVDLEDAILKAQEFARRINNETMRVIAQLKGESTGASFACTCHHGHAPCHCCPLHRQLALYELEVLDAVCSMGHELSGRGFSDVRHGGRFEPVDLAVVLEKGSRVPVALEDDERLTPLPHRPGRCSSCADAGIDTVVGRLWCARCEGAQCARCCGNVVMHALAIDHLETIGVFTIGAYVTRDDSGAELHTAAVLRRGDEHPEYYDVDRTREGALSGARSYVEQRYVEQQQQLERGGRP